MKKILIIILIIGILGIAWYLGSPLFLDKKVNEAFPIQTVATSTQEIVATGMFTGFDAIHNGTGTASIIKAGEKSTLRFEENFNVNNGPDLYVGFGKDGVYKEGSEIARLKGNIGAQNYELPEGFDITQYNEVWVWCKLFSTPFVKARLVPIK